MEDTDWEAYGTGRYEKCANCMVHCGYEGPAVDDSVSRPWRAAMVALAGVRTEGAMAPEIPLDKQRPAEFVFESLVDDTLAEPHADGSYRHSDEDVHRNAGKRDRAPAA